MTISSMLFFFAEWLYNYSHTSKRGMLLTSSFVVFKIFVHFNTLLLLSSLIICICLLHKYLSSMSTSTTHSVKSTPPSSWFLSTSTTSSSSLISDPNSLCWSSSTYTHVQMKSKWVINYVRFSLKYQNQQNPQQPI